MAPVKNSINFWELRTETNEINDVMIKSTVQVYNEGSKGEPT